MCSFGFGLNTASFPSLTKMPTVFFISPPTYYSSLTFCSVTLLLESSSYQEKIDTEWVKSFCAMSCHHTEAFCDIYTCKVSCHCTLCLTCADTLMSSIWCSPSSKFSTRHLSWTSRYVRRGSGLRRGRRHRLCDERHQC